MRSGNPRILVELPGDNYCLKQLMIIGNMEYLLGLVDARLHHLSPARLLGFILNKCPLHSNVTALIRCSEPRRRRSDPLLEREGH